MTSNIIKAAVIGNPITHSLSPKLHNFWLKKYNINGNYEALNVKEEELEDTVKSMVQQGYAGFNVTIPHKEKIFQLIKSQGEISNAASFIKAINTVIITPNKQLQGFNSDEYGFAENLKTAFPNINFKEKNAFVIGAGGAARAIIFSLLFNLEVSNIFVTNRSKEKFEQIYNDFSQKTLHQNYSNSEKNLLDCLNKKLSFLEKSEFENQLNNCDLLINSTSLGMLGQPELELDLTNLKKSAIVYDIVYKPLLTKLLKNAEKQGNKIVTGIGMLAFQGAFGFEKWFAHKPEIDNQLFKLLMKHSQN